MDKQESDCPIYIDLDTSHLGSLSSIRKNLEENKLSKKVKAMEDLLLSHLRGDDVSGCLMDTIRFVVPNNNHRIKRLVYLFFQTFNMNKPDGTPRDELILVCNALRNDLCSPNEFIRGSVLRLISRLNIFGLIQPLIPSIIDNIEHREPYVYRNALLCLTNISDQFGSDLITPSFKSVENFITSSDDVFGTVRAYKLLESCNLDLCIQFIIAIERNLLNLSPVVHLAILGSFDRFSTLGEDVAQMMARILFLLLQFSSDNAVLFYCSNLLLKYPHLNQMDVCCKSLIKVLLNESDLNVKIIIIDKLNLIQSSSTSNKLARGGSGSHSFKLHKVDNVLENYVNDLLKGLSVSNLVITHKLLSLILKVTTKSNVESILDSLVRSFVKVDQNYSPDEIAKYRSLVVRALFSLTKTYSVYVLNVLGGMLSYLTDPNELIAQQVSLLVYWVLTTANASTEKVNETTPNGSTSSSTLDTVNKLVDQLVQNLNEVAHKDVLRNCLYIVGEFCNDFGAVNHLYQLVTTNAGNTSSRGAYNVILEDGSYSTNYTYTSSEVGLYRLLSKNRDILLFNTFSMTLLKLVYRFYKGANAATPGTHNLVEHSCMIVVKLINMSDGESSGLKRLKMVMLLLLGLLKQPEKYLRMIGAYLVLCANNTRLPSAVDVSPDGLAATGDFVGPIGEQFDVDIDLDDFFQSGLDSTAAAPPAALDPLASAGMESITDDKLAMEGSSATPEFFPGMEGDFGVSTDALKYGLPSTMDGLGSYSKVHQFTSLTDPIYVEGFAKLIGTKLYFYLFLENKTKEVLQNISLDLSASAELELITPKKLITLLPNTVKSLIIKFRVTGTADTVVFGYVYFSFSNTIVLQCLTFNPISVSLYEFIRPSVIGPAKFRRNWDQFEWEHKLNLTGVKVGPSELLSVIARFTHLSVVGQSGLNAPKGGLVSGGLDSLDQGLAYDLDSLGDAFEGFRTGPSEPTSFGSENGLTGTNGSAHTDVLVNDSFVSVNLFLKTLFDEEAIANLSLVKKENDTYSGCFRIRSRKQSVASGLGERIGMVCREIAI